MVHALYILHHLHYNAAVAPSAQPLDDILTKAIGIVHEVQSQERQLLSPGSSDPVSYTVVHGTAGKVQGTGTAWWSGTDIRIQDASGTTVYSVPLSAISSYTSFNRHTLRLMTASDILELVFPIHDEYQTRVAAIRQRVADGISPYLAASADSLSLGLAGDTNRVLLSMPDIVSQQYLSHAIRWKDSLEAASIPNLAQMEINQVANGRRTGNSRVSYVLLAVVLICIILVILFRFFSAMNSLP